jgi:glycosyltransferase involved in cell wall biosynthesis
VGSAPWTREQFHTKGVDALLALVQQVRELRLIFLWRGVLGDEMSQRVRSAGLDRHVEVLDEHVDVNAVLARSHAAVALASASALIKAYPYSLVEALAAGRPVLVSRSIPMAQYVGWTKCGVVVDEVDVDSIQEAWDELWQNYSTYQKRALRIGGRDFAPENMYDAYDRIYEGVQ